MIRMYENDEDMLISLVSMSSDKDGAELFPRERSSTSLIYELESEDITCISGSIVCLKDLVVKG